ncbi:hypothetical protein AA80_07565 [Petrotoga sibirica DSM 13575]|uniref:Uncharacterized protein n=1 Tax=Petrotoga sibirica DSM 13575 TaxID=1122956 RepID=A0A855MST5_9BACT|nr:hypothetical protein AA80_07565 [Petrotoga sibirica DSM 13575]POZ90579.1 hypothetical protein AD60_06145 [Petrotoga sp. SL27]
MENLKIIPPIFSIFYILYFEKLYHRNIVKLNFYCNKYIESFSTIKLKNKKILFLTGGILLDLKKCENRFFIK